LGVKVDIPDSLACPNLLGTKGYVVVVVVVILLHEYLILKFCSNLTNRKIGKTPPVA
jgi:hypothetical protein